MSIYIKGMGMPKSCSDCKIFCGLPYQLRDKKGRRPDCPLVPVPPHGRLIDADEKLTFATTDEYGDSELRDYTVMEFILNNLCEELPEIIIEAEEAQ